MDKETKKTSTTKEITDSLMVVNRVISETTSTLEAEKVLAVLLDGVVELLQADAAVALLVDSGQIVNQITRNIAYEFMSVDQFVMSINSIRSIPDIYQSADFPKNLIDLGVRSALCVPTDVPDEKKVCLCVFMFSEHTFTRHEMYIAEVLLTAVASALRNCMLFETVTKSRKLWIEIIDAITDYVFVLGDDGQILKVNLAFARFIGKHPKDFTGGHYTDIFAGDRGSALLPFMETNDFATPFTREVDMGGDFYMVSGFPISLSHDQKAMVFTMKNITDIKKLQEKLYHSDKLTSIGLLVSGVAHEINNPLTGILGYTELLKMKTEEGPLRNELSKIYASAERCKSIVENLLTFSRQRPSERHLESINAILDRTVELRAYWFRSYDIEIVADYENVPYTLLDPQQIQQVFLNLLINAEDAINSPEINHPGKIILKTRYAPEKKQVTITVTDNGIGIDSQNLSRIFDPFFSTKPIDKGTGLGLSIAHGIIKEHGGEITVDSVKNKFTTFIIRLPVLSPGGFPQSSVVQ